VRTSVALRVKYSVLNSDIAKRLRKRRIDREMPSRPG